MKQNIRIQNLCAENFNAMLPVNDGKHCRACNTEVIDFTKMSLDEIEAYFKNNSSQKICGRYNARHTNKLSGYTFLNKIENYLFKTRFRKLAVWTISVVFFLLNSYKCMGKRVYSEPVKEKQVSQNDTIKQK